MLPPGFEPLIGIGIDLLQEMTGMAADLKRILSEARSQGPIQGVYSRFRGRLVDMSPAVKMFGPSNLYRAARYWLDMPKYMAKWPQTQQIELGAMQPSIQPKGEADVLRTYSYRFDIITRNEQGEILGTIQRSLVTRFLLSPAQAELGLRNLLMERSDKYEQLVRLMRGEDPGSVEFRFTNAFHLIYEG